MHLIHVIIGVGCVGLPLAVEFGKQYHTLQYYDMQVDCYNPWINPQEAEHEYGIKPIEQPQAGEYAAVAMAEAHKRLAETGA